MCTSSLLKFYFGGRQVNVKPLIDNIPCCTVVAQKIKINYSNAFIILLQRTIVAHWARNELYSFYISDRQDPNAMSYVGYLNQEWNAGSTGLGGCDWGGAVLDMVVTMLTSLLQPIR